MGLRCSLLGHDFGDVVVERDRDVRGEEIVVTERELRECRRCDAESIIAENTEVRRKRPTDPGREDSPAGGSGTPDSAHETDATSEDATSLVEEAEQSAAEREQANEDAIILDDTGETTGSDAPAQRGSSADTNERVPGDSDPVSGETVSVPGDSDSAPEDSARGTADSEPAAEDGDPDAIGADPTAGRDDDGHEAFGTASASDAQPDAADSSPDSKWPNDPDTRDRAGSSDGDAGVGSGREPTDQSAFEFGDEDEADPGPGDPSLGIASAGPIDTTSSPEGGLEGVLRCPACEYAVPIARSPNRAGDICPDCHAGYLAEDR